MLILASAFVLPSTVLAGTVDTTYTLRINILPDTSVDINLQIDIFNKTDQIVSRYEVILPYAEPQNLQTTRDGQQIGAELRSQKQVSVDFGGSALRPQQSTSLNLKYRSAHNLGIHDGIYTLLVPTFVPSSGENTSYAVTVTYPEDFPPLLYQSPSVVQDSTRVLRGTNPRSLIFIWGKEVRVGLAEAFPIDFSTNAASQGQVNLLPDYTHQDVYYQEIATGGALAHQKNGNLWFLVDKSQPFTYKATVLLKQLEGTTDFGDYDYYRFSGAPDLSKAESQGEKVQAIYDAVVHALAPAPQTQPTHAENLSKLGDRVKAANEKFTDVEYATYLAGVLKDAGFATRIVYGYLIDLDNLPNFNSSLPHTWVEVQLDTRLVTLDPYLEDVSGFSFYNTTRLNRLQFGVWDPRYESDKLLGLLADNVRKRPQLTSPIRDIAVGTIQITAENFPRQMTTASLFTGNLVVQNHTARVLAVKRLSWDSLDITASVLRVNSFLTRAIRPQTTETLSSGPLILPNLVYDGTINHIFTLVPAQDALVTVSTEVPIAYTTNFGVFGLLAVVTLGVILLCVGVLFRKEGLIKQWRLYRIRSQG